MTVHYHRRGQSFVVQACESRTQEAEVGPVQQPRRQRGRVTEIVEIREKGPGGGCRSGERGSFWAWAWDGPGWVLGRA